MESSDSLGQPLKRDKAEGEEAIYKVCLSDQFLGGFFNLIPTMYNYILVINTVIFDHVTIVIYFLTLMC